MMTRTMCMDHVSPRSVCTANTVDRSVYMNAACYFSALRFYFYFYFYFTGLHSSKRQRIS